MFYQHDQKNIMFASLFRCGLEFFEMPCGTHDLFVYCDDVHVPVTSQVTSLMNSNSYGSRTSA